MQVREAHDDEKPICPHCEEDVDEVIVQAFDQEGIFQIKEKYIFFCSKCRKVLGIGQFAYNS
jgi:hypothetical protein